jgi:hypothetical protein
MKAIAEELDRQLSRLGPAMAEQVERLVRDALALADESARHSAKGEWPEGYFARTSGAMAGETFERAEQGESPERETW